MIAFLVKLTQILKPYQKLTYFFATLILINLVYQFVFLESSMQADDKATMFSLLGLIWLVLVNLMLQIFIEIPEKTQGARSVLAWIKHKLHQMLYYILSFLFIGLSISLIILSFKMMRV